MSPSDVARHDFQNVYDLEAGLAEAVLRWTLSLADTKHRIGMRTSEWVNGTPALEGAVAASAITQDELGHARSYFSMLRDFPGAPDAIGFENDLEARDVYYNPRLLNEPWPSWLDVIAVSVLLDRALTIAVQATGNSSYAPLRQRTAKILQEEAYHRIFGDSWLARLARGDEKTKGRLQASINRFWAVSQNWFGPDDEAITGQLNQAAILQATPAQMRDEWRIAATSLLEEHGLSAPDDRPDWSLWDSDHRDIV
jgi:phenylacetate-CoA oxygenase PaaI subunit